MIQLFVCYRFVCLSIMFVYHCFVYSSLGVLPFVVLPLVIYRPHDSAATGAQTSHSFSNTPQSGATVAMMLSSDDEGGASETQRESSFVSTYLGDGIMDIRDRSQRNGTIEGTHKVRLSWATAYLRPE